MSSENSAITYPERISKQSLQFPPQTLKVEDAIHRPL